MGAAVTLLTTRGKAPIPLAQPNKSRSSPRARSLFKGTLNAVSTSVRVYHAHEVRRHDDVAKDARHATYHAGDRG